jgi:hypothetical protein
MTTGVAYAQTVPSDSAPTESIVSSKTTTTSTTPFAPPETTVTSVKTEKTIDANGTETDRHQTYNSTNNATHATSEIQTTGTDGSLKISTHDDATSSSPGATSTKRTITETTTTN